jgi:hypothetical protein
LKFEIE